MKLLSTAKTAASLLANFATSLPACLVAIVVALFTSASLCAQTDEGLVRLLKSAREQCEVTPDSIFPTIRALEGMSAAASDPCQRAVIDECLALLYEGHRYTAQHDSHGEQLEEWGREQWTEAANRKFDAARTNLDALRRARAAQWEPLIALAKGDGDKFEATKAVAAKSATAKTDAAKMLDGEAWYDGDLLHVLHRNHPTDAVAQYYEAHVGGNAAIMARLEVSRQETGDTATLRALLGKAQDDASVAAEVRVQVYLALANALCGSNNDEAMRVANECLARYPKVDGVEAVRNLANSMCRPTLTVDWPALCYPGREYRVPVTYRNMTRFTVAVGDRKLSFACQPAAPHVTVEDTVTFVAPPRGKYNLSVTPVSNAYGATVGKLPSATMYVSKLRLLRLPQAGNDPSQYIVVDGVTGQRAEGQRVDIFNQPTKYLRENLMVRIVGDPQPAVQHFRTWQWEFDDRTYNQTLINTDRAIYRPGQTVHLTAVLFARHHWEAAVRADRDVPVAAYDRKHQLIFSDTLRTDQFGSIATSFVLPKDMPLGNCRVVVDNMVQWIKVEEYKRPTFEALIDKTLDESDSLARITLEARNYNGTPQRGARVTGRAVVRGYWWRNGNEQEQVFDTLYTDADGRLVLPVRVPQGKDERRGRCLEVTLDVTSATGETHTANRVFRLSDEERPAEPDTMPQGAKAWFKVRRDTISPQQPAVIEIGSALRDVNLHVAVFRQNKCIRNEVIVFSDSFFTMEFGWDLIDGHDQCDGLCVSMAFMRDEELHTRCFALKREMPDTRLRWAWTTFRDRVQPGNREQWSGRLLTPDGKPADAQAAFTIYDASLDAFAPHSWNMSRNMGHSIPLFSFTRSSTLRVAFMHVPFNFKYLATPYIIYYGLDHELLPQAMPMMRVRGGMVYSAAAPMMSMKQMATGQAMNDGIAVEECADDAMLCESVVTMEDEAGGANGAEAALAAVKARGDFSELAYFAPALLTDADGCLTIDFTLPDCMTTWQIMGAAHTRDMMTEQVNCQTVAQKTLMCMVDVPRFVRQGDEASAAVTLQNISGERQTATLRVELIDSETGDVTATLAQAMTVELERDTTLRFALPATTRPFIVKAVAVAGTNSDGEQREVPVLDDSEWIANATDLMCSGEGNHVFDVDSLFAGKALERRMTLHYTEAPVWTAIDVLGNLQTPQHDDVISLHTAFYATALTNYLCQQHQPVAEHLHYNHDEASARADQLLERLGALQNSNGGYSWFNCFHPSYWLTLEVATSFARLQKMTGQHYRQADRAMAYLRTQVAEMVKERRRDKVDYCTLSDWQYLYVLALRNETLNSDAKYLLEQFMKQRDKLSREEMAIGTIVLRRYKSQAEAQEMENQMRLFVVKNERQGAFFSYLRGSFTSIDRKLLDHIYAMEAVEGDEWLLPDMRRWLLQQKRVQAWENPLYNAAAVYALLLGKEYNLNAAQHDRLLLDKNVVDIVDGKHKQTMTLEKPIKKVVVEKHNATESWGAVYVESRKRLDEIVSNTTGLAVRRYVEGGKAEGEPARVGDRMTVRLVITADRDYEHVHLTVPRAACFESTQTVSSYKYQGGLSYYHEVHDDVDDLFFERMPKGSYVITLGIHAVRPGTYNAGITKIECMYAPEFCGNTANEIVRLVD